MIVVGWNPGRAIREASAWLVSSLESVPQPGLLLFGTSRMREG